ncbi:MAG TPA: DNA-binding protein [Candidatus Cloacimonadota bacterium]|jgi:predicted DNA-binding protein with PD1-like motif|nr:DNA-binding protein [Candidatus Cloacimonadales bacterium]HPY95870.1 DNA-binding protein [Candidatus Cloacimonadota bacterium]HQB41035.1 DNA-binding protein [Candidatus Cloacimonadota bacterium]
MKSRKVEWGYVLRLYKGEEVVSSLSNFVREKKIIYCLLSGIGACTDAKISYYSMQNKEYIETHLNSFYEIVSLSGNIISNGNQTVVHVHILLSDDKFHCFGGHLNSAIVTATCEVNLIVSEERIDRQLEEDTKLNLLKL